MPCLLALTPPQSSDDETGVSPVVANDDDANLPADQRRREVIAILATGAMRWHRRAKATGLGVGSAATATHAPQSEHQEEADIELELGEEAPPRASVCLTVPRVNGAGVWRPAHDDNRFEGPRVGGRLRRCRSANCTIAPPIRRTL